MRKSGMFLLLALMLSGAAYADRGGVEVGNGGNIIQCRGYDQAKSLDYLVMRRTFGEDFELRSVQTSRAALEKIGQLVAEKLPALSASFSEYVSQIESQDSSKHYVWIESNDLLERDQDLPGFAVANYCLDSAGAVQVLQTIVRSVQPSPQGSQVVFFYDRGLLHSLYAEQRSFVLVHEWLWNFTDNLTTNREADWLLHSVWFEKATSAEAIQTFKALGLRYP